MRGLRQRQEMAAAKAALKAARAAAGRQPRLTRLAPGQHLETRGVLSGAYRGKDISERALLTHAVLVEGVRPGHDVRTLCSQPIDSMVDTYSDPEGIYEAPTCRTCLPRWEKLQERYTEEVQREFGLEQGTGRFGISCEGKFPFRSARAAEAARKKAVKSLRVAAQRSPGQYAEQLARYEAAEVVEQPAEDMHAEPDMERNGALRDPSRQDLEDAVGHARDAFDLDISLDDLSISSPRLVSVAVLYGYDDIDSWLDLQEGADDSELRDFRGSSWADRAKSWLEPSDMPPIVILDIPEATAISDGRGRTNYAIARGWSEVPVVFLTKPDLEPNARRRGSPLHEGELETGRVRGTSGRFLKGQACDFCGKSCASGQMSDERVCGNTDGPGFMLCDKFKCERERSEWERAYGLKSLGERYAKGRRLNEERESKQREAPIATKKPFRPSYDMFSRTGALQHAESHGHQMGPWEGDVATCQRCGKTVVWQEGDGPRGDAWQRGSRCEMRSNGTIYTRKFHLRRGYLLEPKDVTAADGKVYQVDLEFQVFDAETGAPIEDTSTVEGELQGDRLIVGDPHRDTRLYEYKVDMRPTRESEDYWKGFRAAISDRQWHQEGKSKKYYGNTQSWWDGYNQGHRDKRDPSAGYTPNSERRYYVWVLLSDDTPKDEGPYGPYEFIQAKDFARISATEGEHDRAVSIGLDPQSPSFHIARRYERGTGRRIQ